MFPKLYHSNETNFTHNGLGLLRDAITAVATEELNGMFRLEIEYDSEGFLVDEIKEEMIIKAKANDKQDEQLFRINSITKSHENDNLIINARHITYDFASNFVESLVARNLTKRQVMQLIGSSTAYPHPFNVTSSNTTTQSSTSLYRTNPLQMIAGMEGSVLQIWGGQIERDNFNLIMHDRRGSDDGVLVTYKKNLTGLVAEFHIKDLVTRIFPFIYIEDEDRLITVPGKYIDSPHINDYEMPYILPVDFSHEFENLEEVTSQQLNNVAQNWFVETGRDKLKTEMEVRFEHLWETEEYKHLAVLELVGMGDTVTTKHKKLNVEATAIVNRIEYDCIARKNIAVDVGNVKAKFTDKVNEVGTIVDRVEQAETNANQAIRAANGKNTIYYGPDEPTDGNVDDIWFRVVDGEYTRTYRFDGIQWQLVISKDVADIEETANTAHNRANEAVGKAELATSNANEALELAQEGFDDAQTALTRADSAFSTAGEAFTQVSALSTMVNDQTGEISSIKQSVIGLQTSVSDAEGNASNALQIATGLQTKVSNIEGDVTTLQTTATGFATRIENAEGGINTLTSTAQGLQNRISNAEGDISTVTNTASALQTRMTSAEGGINTLTATASSLDSTIKSVRDDLDGLEIGGRNLIRDSDFGSDSVLEHWGYWGNTDSISIESHYGYNFLRVLSKPIQGVSYWFRRLPYKLNLKPGIYTLSWIQVMSGGTDNPRVYLRESGGAGVQRDLSDFKKETISRKEIYVLMRDIVKYSVTFELDDTFEDVEMDIAWRFTNNRENNEWVMLTVPKLEKGNKATDWSPAPEDMATQSQITQLSDNINLRVMKGDVINQINIDTSGVLLSGKKLILDGDTTVTGTFRVTSANITSINAGKLTTGTLDAGRISVINLSANSIVGGILQSQNSNMTLNLNTGSLTMQNANFTLGGGANVEFTSSGNKLFYDRNNRQAGLLVGTSINNTYPFVGLGATNLNQSLAATDASGFSGFLANTNARESEDGIQNSVIGRRFHVRNNAIDFTQGWLFDLNGSRKTFSPIYSGNYDYDLGAENNRFDRFYVNQIRGVQAFDVRNYINGLSGWLMETQYSGGGEGITFRGLNGNQFNYNIGANSTSGRINNIYLTYNPNVSSDERLKTDISDLDLGLEFIKRIEPKQFRLKLTNADIAQGKSQNPIQYGIIAQQVNSVLADYGASESSLINNVDNGYYSAQYEQFIPTLIKSDQDLDTKIDLTREELLLKIADLEHRLNKLEVA